MFSSRREILPTFQTFAWCTPHSLGDVDSCCCTVNMFFFQHKHFDEEANFSRDKFFLISFLLIAFCHFRRNSGQVVRVPLREQTIRAMQLPTPARPSLVLPPICRWGGGGIIQRRKQINERKKLLLKKKVKTSPQANRHTPSLLFTVLTSLANWLLSQDNCYDQIRFLTPDYFYNWTPCFTILVVQRPSGLKEKN